MGTDTVRATTPAGVKAAIAQAIADLIASAPGALDTLDELAAALGDDANFAATITAALAGKQPLDADLTAIAALTTTTYGRALLALADLAALKAVIGPTGTPSASTYLRGDGSWSTPAGGGAVATDTIFDAKGDIPVGTGADTAAKLAVGSNGQILRAASAASTGVEWGAAPTVVAPLAANLTGYGLPGRVLVWGGSSATTQGYVYCLPIVCSEDEPYDAYEFRVDTGVASTSMDIALFSCANWKAGTTMTKVSGTETTGTSLATNGTKTATLGATKTPTPGRYTLAFTLHGGASAVNLWYCTSAAGFLGSRPSQGTGAHQEGWVQAVGASSLAASYTIANLATYNVVPVVMRRA